MLVICLLIIRRSHGRRATAIKEMILRPPTASQLARAVAHKAQLLGGAKEIVERDTAPMFVPASPEAHPPQGARKPFSVVDDLDDDSVSSNEDPDDVFRPYMWPLAAEEQLDTPGEYEENYGRPMVGHQQLELHRPISETPNAALPSADLLLSP
eukprot:2043616-Prymnesium_polylepis.1